MRQEMKRMVKIDEDSRENTASIDEDAAYLRVVATDKKRQRLIYELGDRSSAYTNGLSYHSTACSSRNDHKLREHLKDEVRGYCGLLSSESQWIVVAFTN